MADRSNWDPEMAAFTAAGEEEAKAYPPIRLEIPLEPHRRTNDALSMRTAEGGPQVAETTDRWVSARGRRIYCRVYRPRTDVKLPVLIWFHGGGFSVGPVYSTAIYCCIMQLDKGTLPIYQR